jgi:hypothetical protein
VLRCFVVVFCRAVIVLRRVVVVVAVVIVRTEFNSDTTSKTIHVQELGMLHVAIRSVHSVKKSHQSAQYGRHDLDQLL